MNQSNTALADVATTLKCELACEVLRRFGRLCFAATGSSMLPSIWPNDTLIVECVNPEDVRVGDIVLANREGRLLAHRVISLDQNSSGVRWITQGDAMAAPDSPVHRDQLLGKVVGLIRNGKSIAAPAKVSMIGRFVAKAIQCSMTVTRGLILAHTHFAGVES